MKRVVNNISSNIIFDSDIIVTNSDDANKSLDSVLSSHTNRLAKLESNTKWLYKYGGMGSGGGSGSDSSAKVTVTDATNMQPIYQNIDNKIEYSRGENDYSYTIKISRPGTSIYTLAWQWQEADSVTGEIITKNDSKKIYPENPNTTITVHYNINTNLNIVVTDVEGKEFVFNARIIINAYQFSTWYVDKDHNPIVATAGNIFMDNEKDRGLFLAFRSEVNTSLNRGTVSYTYTDWLGKTHTVECEHCNEPDQSLYPDEIASNMTKIIYLNLIPEDAEQSIYEYLADFNNAGSKYFYLDIKMHISGKTYPEEIDTMVINTSLIPSNMYLKIDTLNGILETTRLETLSCFKYTDFQWKEYTKTGTESIISAEYHDNNTYTTIASKNLLIVEDSNYYRFENNSWSDPIDPSTLTPELKASAKATVSHTTNIYQVEASEGNIIEENVAEYDSKFTIGSTMEIELTPFDGAYQERTYTFEMSCDGYPVPYAKINNVKTLTELKMLLVPFLINNDTKKNHEFTFAISRNLQYYITKRYYSTKELIAFDWYGDTVPDYNNNYRKGQTGCKGIRDSKTKKTLTNDSIVEFTANSPKTTDYEFIYYPSSSEIKRYDLMICVGMQYSAINDTSSPIFSLIPDNSNNTGKIDVYPDKILAKYSEDADPAEYPITILKEPEYNKNDNEKYHLFSIYTRLEHLKITASIGSNVYRSISFFVNGILDAAFAKFITVPRYKAIRFYNGNYNVNLIEESFFESQHPKSGPGAKYSEFSYNDVLRYYYAYDEKILGHGYPIERYEEYQKKQAVYNAFNQIEFNDENFAIVKTASNPRSVIGTIVVNSEANVLLMHFDDSNGNGIVGTEYTGFGQDNLKEWMSVKWGEGSNEAKRLIPVTLSWADSTDTDVLQIMFNDKTQDFTINLLGSSTMNYRTKNFELAVKLPESSEGSGLTTYKVFSPNFKASDKEVDPEAYRTFLPEKSFTLKADVVDSSHSNNNTLGDFINDLMTKFPDLKTEIGTAKYGKYVKSCLVGFPTLLFLHTSWKLTKDSPVTETYYFLGIYNFNLGRESYFNLGYNELARLNDLDIKNGFNVYELPSDSIALNTKVRVAEVSNNEKCYDFSQSDSSLIEEKTSDDKGNMFNHRIGDGIVTDLEVFVNKISQAGGFIFEEIGKNFVTTKSASEAIGYGYDDPYCMIDEEELKSKNIVPYYRVKLKRKLGSGGNEFVCEDPTDLKPQIQFEDLAAIIEGYEEGSVTHQAAVNYTSISEYYAICMAFGMVDSVEKNLQVKSWNNGETFNIAFYDMDTCLGINNNGVKIKFFAFSDYWASNYDGGLLKSTTVQYDFSPKKLRNVEGNALFDVPSSYLFAIPKYAYSIYKKHGGSTAGIANHPNYYWSQWRLKNGVLCNADNFINKYYKHHLDSIPSPAFNFNYCYKYFVSEFDETTEEKTCYFDNNDSAEFVKFHGRNLYYVKEWLANRFHVLDAYFNFSKAVDYVGNGVAIIVPETVPLTNEDVYILHDIFSSSSSTIGNIHDSDIEAYIKMLPNMPLIAKSGENATGRFIAPENVDELFKIVIPCLANKPVIIGGSAAFTEIKSVDPFITTNYNLYLKSSYITYLNGKIDDIQHDGAICNNFSNVYVPAAKTINLTSKNYKGPLTFTLDYNNLISADISYSGILLKDEGSLILILKAVLMQDSSVVDIVNAGQLSSLELTGKLKKVTLPVYTKTMNVNTFSSELLIIENTKYDTSKSTEQVTLNIASNSTLTALTVNNVTNLNVSGCPNLKSISFNGTTTPTALKTLTISGVCGTSFLIGNDSNVVDLSLFKNLTTVKINNAAITNIKFHPEATIKLPDSAFKDCINLIKLTPGESGSRATNFYINGPSVFAGCNAFTLSTLHPIEKNYLHIQTGLLNFSNMFNCKDGSLTNDDVYYFLNTVCTSENRSVVTNISYLFAGHKNIKYKYSLSTENDNFTPDYRAGICSKLALDFPNVNTANNVYADTGVEVYNKYMFSNLGTSDKVSTINIDNFITSLNPYATIDFLEFILPKLLTLTFFSTEEDVLKISFLSIGATKSEDYEYDCVALKDVFNPNGKKPEKLTKLVGFNVANWIIDFTDLFDSKWTSASSNGLDIQLFCYMSYASSILVNRNEITGELESPFETLFRNIKIKNIINCFSALDFYEKIHYEEEEEEWDEYEPLPDYYANVGGIINWNQIGSANELFKYTLTKNRAILNFQKQISYNIDILDEDDSVKIFSFLHIWDCIANNNTITTFLYLFNNINVIFGDNTHSEEDPNPPYIDGLTFYLNTKQYRTDNKDKARTAINSKLSNIDHIFDGMRMRLSLEEETSIKHYLSFSSELFKFFKGLKYVSYSFNNLLLEHTIPYNFFNKREPSFTKEIIYIDDDPLAESYTKAYNHAYIYTLDMLDFTNCFADAEFKNIAGFNPYDEYNKKEGTDVLAIESSFVTYSQDGSGEKISISCYYASSVKSIRNPKIKYLNATEFEDCNDLSTDYLSTTTYLSNDIPILMKNFDLGNTPESYSNKTFVAPDIFYGANANAKFGYAFANTKDTNFQMSTKSTLGEGMSSEDDYSKTFTGALPKNMFSKCKTTLFSNAFLNINVLPASIGKYPDTVNKTCLTSDTNLIIVQEINGEDKYFKYNPTEDKWMDNAKVDAAIRALKHEDHTEDQRSTYVAITKMHECYSYVPSKFTECKASSNMFNFRIFMPKAAEIENECTHTYEYYIMLYDSIKYDQTSIEGIFPSRFCMNLLRSDNIEDDDYNFAYVNFTSKLTLMGEPVYNSTTAELLNVKDGINIKTFNSLYFSNLANAGLMRIMKGIMIRNGDAAIGGDTAITKVQYGKHIYNLSYCMSKGIEMSYPITGENYKTTLFWSASGTTINRASLNSLNSTIESHLASTGVTLVGTK